MTLWRRIADVLRAPTARLQDELAEPESPVALLTSVVLPLTAIRGLAVLVRSLFAGSVLAGLVLGAGNVVLQLGTWLGLGLVLPALARQFTVELSDRRAFALATLALTPMWLSGVLFLLPEDWFLAALWSRILAAAISLYGVAIFFRGLVVLDVPRQVRPALTAAAIGATAVLYLVLFAALGLTSNVILLLSGGD